MAKSKNNKICNSCEAKVSAELKTCQACGADNFRPEFIEKRREISKNFSVNIFYAKII